MRVALTGHLGYVGTVMTPMLLAAGHEVVGFDTDLYAASNFEVAGSADVPTIGKDIRDLTEADLVDWQMDVFWTVQGGADPRAGRSFPSSSSSFSSLIPNSRSPCLPQSLPLPQSSSFSSSSSSPSSFLFVSPPRPSSAHGSCSSIVIHRLLFLLVLLFTLHPSSSAAPSSSRSY